jgi:ATP-dependent helicase/nuclease subunit A
MSAVVRKIQPDIKHVPEQWDAANPASSAWVAASAGSGKTRVLANRVIRLLLDGAPPQNILCITYTRAGAAEMADRITKDLSTWAVCPLGELQESLRELLQRDAKQSEITLARQLFARMLDCPGGLRIKTIHSFCQELLQRFPLEASVAPHFNLLDETEARAWQHDAFNALMAEAAADREGALYRSLRVFLSRYKLPTLQELMREFLSNRERFETALQTAGSLPVLAKAVHDFYNVPETASVYSIF